MQYNPEMLIKLPRSKNIAMTDLTSWRFFLSLYKYNSLEDMFTNRIVTLPSYYNMMLDAISPEEFCHQKFVKYVY
jgi:hypothetical protein